MPWFEDYAVGDVRRFGHYAVTADEVVDFARRYDPQPFHLSEEGGRAHPYFGALTASGWHVTAMAMAMLVAEMPEGGDPAALGASGIDELRWLKPVKPGDLLSLETEVIDARLSEGRPGLGRLQVRTTVLRQGDEPVCRFTALVMVRTRPS